MRMGPMNIFYQNFFTSFRPSEEFKDVLTSHLHNRVFRSKEVWIGKGQLLGSIGFILNGFALGYSVSSGQKELQRIWSASEVLLPLGSELKSRKSPLEIVCPVETQILELDFKDILLLRNQYPEMQELWDAIIAKEMNEIQDQIKFYKNLSAVERIQQFKKSFNTLHYLLPEEVKASFVGVSRRWFNYNK